MNALNMCLLTKIGKIQNAHKSLQLHSSMVQKLDKNDLGSWQAMGCFACMFFYVTGGGGLFIAKNLHMLHYSPRKILQYTTVCRQWGPSL